MTEVKNATLYISGYEWGPGVSKVIFALSTKVENVLKDGAKIRTSKKDREITAIYLSNEKGDKTTEHSTHVTMELKPYFDREGSCNPFTFNIKDLHNAWASSYIIKVTFQVTVSGKPVTLSFEGDCINNRICPDTEQFSQRGKFTGEYKNQLTGKNESLTLYYAAYEPKNLKEDNAKNPLIIWIHGIGEGGTDLEVNLLGNQVTALSKPKIQSYFTTEHGSNGIYVLSIMCETMWMDTGNGMIHNGDLHSRYEQILTDTIHEYVNKINPDVDQNRIYLGGCSNGGFMTMNMAILHPEMWAACYMTCECYAYYVFKRDSKGNYVRIEGNNIPSANQPTEERYFTDEKIERIRNIPMWLIASASEDTVVPSLFSLPTYKQFLKLGLKNVWFSYFKTIESCDVPGTEYSGHWSWVRFFDDQVTKVQDPEKIVNSNDNETFGTVPTNDGGGCLDAKDEKGTYTSIFAWLNAQVKKH